MICNNCKAEWKPPIGVSITQCPFCGKPLFEIKDPKKDTEPHEILHKIVQQYDKNILGKIQLKGILSDLMPHIEKKYQRIFKQALDDRIGLKLLELADEDNSIRIVKLKTLKDSFKNHNGFNDVADYVFDCFLFALGWISSLNKDHYNRGTVDNHSIINAQIDLAFVDGELSKEEAKTLFSMAAILGLSDDDMAAEIAVNIARLNLKPSVEIKKSVKNPKDIICSSDWHSEKKAIPKIAVEGKKTYKTIKIGKQIWMAENLDTDKFSNGDIIPYAGSDAEWIKAAKNKKPAWCYLNNDPENGEIYGKLYNWYAVEDERGLAPKGWRVPDYDEWDELYDFMQSKLGEGEGITYEDLVEFGFSVIPGSGMKTIVEFEFYECWWWTTSDPYDYEFLSHDDYPDVQEINGIEEDGSYLASCWLLEDAITLCHGIRPKAYGLSIRCLKN